MYRRRKTKGFFYYFKTLIYAAIAVCAGYCVYQKIVEEQNRFNADEILAQSVLQNKTFTAKVQEIEESGVKAYLMEEHSNPIVSIDFEFGDSGYAHDQNGKFGLAQIASRLIMKGAGKYSDKTLLDIMEENGIRISFGVDNDSLSGAIIFPKSNSKTAQYLLRLIMFEPKLPEKHLEIIKAQLLKSLEMQNENPNSVLSLVYAEQIFANHPYARNPLGKKEDIFKISTDDVRRYLEKTFAKNNLIVGISGDINQKESKVFLKDIFGELPEKTGQKPLEKFEYNSKGMEFNVKRNIPQVIAIFSAKGTARTNKDFYPLYLANYIFGGSGLTSRLNKELRENNGLTYGVYHYMANSDAASLLEGKFSASTENFEKAKKLLLEQWQNLALNGVSENELEIAKKSLIDSFNLRFADISGVSSMLVAMQKYNLGRDFLQKRNDYIRNVTLEKVNETASKYYGVEPDFVTIGDERKNK